ncbi:hypothetical protein Pcinc_013129 [Petrolisthes cinctipes]|uniref:Uncharacterized protein n=1 Tax=Petrolisthes cinctipes TaxID=88211 RepID=A0AAE1KQP3_PETCI|nr:hypothetical protein Pcinc_013129 [Petrolisthes cinctipes]
MLWAWLVWAAGLLIFTPISRVHAHLGSCEDHTPQCPRYAEAGYCNTRRQFMLLNCPVSCDACLDPNCYDRSHRCSSLAAQGNCLTQPNYMLHVCPHSCDNCRIGGPAARPPPDPRTRPTIARPNFECGKGQVTTNTNRNLASSSSSSSSGGVGGGRVNLRVGRQVIFPHEDAWRPPPFPNPRTSPQTSPQKNPVRLPDNPAPPVDESIPMVPGKVDMMMNSLSVQDTFCGATPLHNRFLLTAAHCVLQPDKPTVTVRLGELDFSRENEENSRPVDYAVDQIIVHPDYQHTTVIRYNDVALIRTKEEIQFNEIVYPYCISDDRPPPNTKVTGAGFGLINGTTLATHLQEAELDLMDTTQCQNQYLAHDHTARQLREKYPDLLVNRDIICASFPERDACQGDSGGPLFLDRGGKRYLVGVVGSGGFSCRGAGVSSLPGLYASVADHIDFIDSVIYGIS